MRREKDPEKQAKIQLLIQRYENQKRSEQAKAEHEELVKRLKDEKRKELGTSKKRIFLKKCRPVNLLPTHF